MGQGNGNVFRPRDADAHSPNRCAAYGSTSLRAPSFPPVAIDQTLSEITGPAGLPSVSARSADLTANARAGGEPQGERIVVSGRVLDEDERPVPDTLIEIWQTNAAGRYRHPGDRHDAPLDPNFPGDPLFALDPILQGVPEEAARARLVAAFSLTVTEPGRALGYE